MHTTGQRRTIKAGNARSPHSRYDTNCNAPEHSQRSGVLLITLPQITVLSGVLAYETLQKYSDLVLGDTYCFRHCTTVAPAQMLSRRTLLLNKTPDIGSRHLKISSYRDIVLMTHTGLRVDAAVIDAQIGTAHSLVVLPHWADLSPDYDLIACGPDHAASTTCAS